jgi:hypothetical protein
MGLQVASKRKRLAIREPNGKPSRAGREREYPPAQVKRLREAALSGLRDPEWGTELGRLLLNGVITDAMYAAGKRWAELAARYKNVLGIFPIKSSSAEGGSWGHQPDPDSPRGQEIAKADRNSMEAYFEAEAALVMHMGPGVLPMVRSVCEEGQIPGGYYEVLNLRIGLLKLVTHWGLTK